MTAQTDIEEKALHWFVVLRDITSSRVQKRRVAKLSKIAELTSHMVILTDADAYIVWVTPAFEKRPGWRVVEMATGHDPMVSDPAGLTAHLVAIQRGAAA